jgi:hypothetical protein
MFFNRFRFLLLLAEDDGFLRTLRKDVLSAPSKSQSETFRATTWLGIHRRAFMTSFFGRAQKGLVFTLVFLRCFDRFSFRNFVLLRTNFTEIFAPQ